VALPARSSRKTSATDLGRSGEGNCRMAVTAGGHCERTRYQFDLGRKDDVKVLISRKAQNL